MYLQTPRRLQKTTITALIFAPAPSRKINHTGQRVGGKKRKL